MSTPFSRRRASRLSAPTHPRVDRAARFAVEALERRQLLSAGTFLPSIDTPTAVLRQGEQLIVAGTQAGGDDVTLARFNADGTLDATFGKGGRLVVDLGGTDIIRALTIDNGFILAAGASGNDMAVARFSADDGTLDTGFGGGDGVATAHFDLRAEARSIAVGPGGVIAVGGDVVSDDDGRQSFAVAEFDSGGVALPGFGVGGMQVTQFAFNPNPLFLPDRTAIASIAFHGNDLIVGGQTYSRNVSGSPSYSFTIAEYTSDGELNPDFGTGGVVVTDVLDRGSSITSIAVRGDTLVAIGGDIAQYALQADLSDPLHPLQAGRLDPNFNGGVPFANANAPLQLVVAGNIVDNGIVLAGYVVDATDGFHLATARYNYDGPGMTGTLAPDNMYGVSGLYDTGVIAPAASASDAEVAIATVDSDGSVAMATVVVSPATDRDARVVAVDTVVNAAVKTFDGAVDFTFYQAPTTGTVGQTVTFESPFATPFAGEGFTVVGSWTVTGPDSLPVAGTTAGGTFTFTPTAVGAYVVTYEIDAIFDPDTIFPLSTISVTVNVGDAAPVNTAPTLADPGNKSVNEGQPLAFTLVGADADAGDVLTYSIVSGFQPGMTLNPATGDFSWTPTESQDGAYPVVFGVADNGSPSLSATRSITITVGEVNAAPSLVNPGNKALNEGQTLTIPLVGADADTGPGARNVLTYSIDAGALPGMTLNPATGAFAWATNETQDGPHTVTFRVTDNGSPALFSTQTITITVGEVNQAPTLDPIATPEAAVAGSPLTFTAVGHDADFVLGTPNALTYSLASAPAGAIINAGTGVFTWTPTAAQAGTGYTFTVRVTDNGAGALSASQLVTVNVAPVVVAVPTATLSAGVLTVTGTAGNNTLRVTRNNGNYIVTLDAGTASFPVLSVTRIVINGGDGADTIVLASNVNAPAELHGGAGNDSLTGGGGDDMLFGEDGADLLQGVGGDDIFVGGAGADRLLGGAGQDVLIGGLGSDYIEGDNGSDILIAGRTAQDANPANLAAIRTIWTGLGSYDARINTLKTTLLRPSSSGGTTTVFDDGEIDLLFGGNATDWFVVNLNGSAVDVVLDAARKETFTDL